MKVEITLTDAQIKALPTTPIVVLANPGGKVYQPLYVQIFADFTAGAYTNVNAGVFTTVYSMGRDQDTAQRSGDFFTDNGGVSYFFMPLEPTPASWDYQDADPITLEISNAANGNFTGGNAANTMKVIVTYTEAQFLT